MKVSIVIATNNRRLLLERCLQSLLAATATTTEVEFEFIAVVNGYCTESTEALSKILCRANSKILQIEAPIKPGAARNIALEEVSGEWIFFADDDIYVEKYFFSSFLKLINKRKDYSVLGGPNITPPTSSVFQHLSGYALGSYFVSLKCAQRYRLNRERLDTDDSALTLCNLFVKTSTLAGGRFSDSLICAEENSLLTELAAKGARFLAHPELRVFHERRGDMSAFVRQIVKYGKGRGQLILRGQAQWFHFAPLLLFTVIFLSLISNGQKSLLVYLYVLYAMALLVSILQIVKTYSQPYRELPRLALLVVAVHMGYGLGLFLGIITELGHKSSWAVSKR